MFVEGRTHIGPVRKENQDNFRCSVLDDGAGLAVVCDGMGGVTSGREAGEIAVNTIFQRISSGYRSELDENSIRNLMLSAVNAANSLVFIESSKNSAKKGMGTTCVAAILKGNTAYIVSVGDSRAYLIDSKGISQITNDHTYVEYLYEQGKISKEEIKNHEYRNYITKALGPEESVEVDYFEIDVSDGSTILLCTDGLTNFCSNELIFNFVYEKDINEAVDGMIEYVNTHGGTDNITVVIMKNNA